MSERRPGDDAAILAAMGFMQLEKHGDSNANMLRAVVVLEILLSDSKHNYDALLILVRLYLFLGMASLAAKAYSMLSIKNLQHATLSWILFTRISTTHPWTFTTRSKLKKGPPSSHFLMTAMNWHSTASHAYCEASEKMLHRGQYSTLVDLLEMQTSIQLGFSACLTAMEMLRTLRLTEPSIGSDFRALFGGQHVHASMQSLI